MHENYREIARIQSRHQNVENLRNVSSVRKFFRRVIYREIARIQSRHHYVENLRNVSSIRKSLQACELFLSYFKCLLIDLITCGF